jgi:hypothetical protein
MSAAKGITDSEEKLATLLTNADLYYETERLPRYP